MCVAQEDAGSSRACSAAVEHQMLTQLDEATTFKHGNCHTFMSLESLDQVAEFRDVLRTVYVGLCFPNFGVTGTGMLLSRYRLVVSNFRLFALNFRDSFHINFGNAFKQAGKRLQCHNLAKVHLSRSESNNQAMGKRNNVSGTAFGDSKLMDVDAVGPLKKQRVDESAALSLLALRKTQTESNCLVINMLLYPEIDVSEELSNVAIEPARGPVPSITDDEEDTSSRCSGTTEESPRLGSSATPSIKHLPKIALRKPKLAVLSQATNSWPSLPQGRPLACPPRLPSVSPSKSKNSKQ